MAELFVQALLVGGAERWGRSGWGTRFYTSSPAGEQEREQRDPRDHDRRRQDVNSEVEAVCRRLGEHSARVDSNERPLDLSLRFALGDQRADEVLFAVSLR